MVLEIDHLAIPHEWRAIPRHGLRRAAPVVDHALDEAPIHAAKADEIAAAVALAIHRRCINHE